ncbi:helix-turn-helix transcriptional regulator [Actinophytocola sp. S1-96]|uniref:Helix-turn-helix transcriptional regulator n=1 Tax=Actinophytocola gossypii TaxID=2812003 RepID=A0ABT2JFI5_9PSEU|nr:helix-turn-helix transcriptional regulator [Actinophytocola gossypii]
MIGSVRAASCRARADIGTSSGSGRPASSAIRFTTFRSGASDIAGGCHARPHARSCRTIVAIARPASLRQPPLAYLTWWRMTTAARLLRESDAPLRTVAARCGYSSEFAFAKAFKREYGLAPGQYRRAT